MPVSGRGRRFGPDLAGLDLTSDDLVPRPEQPNSPVLAVVNDWLWGADPPPVTYIPYSWLAQPLRFRPDPPINVAEVTTADGAAARGLNSTSRSEYGQFTPPAGTVQLATPVPADAAAFATYLVNNFNNPRHRCPALTFDLLARTDPERWLILGRQIGDRITVTSAPATWPEGTTSLIIEGIQHAVGIDERTVVWNTAPIVGTTAGSPGPWFRLGSSRMAGTDSVPF